MISPRHSMRYALLPLMALALLTTTGCLPASSPGTAGPTPPAPTTPQLAAAGSPSRNNPAAPVPLPRPAPPRPSSSGASPADPWKYPASFYDDGIFEGQTGSGNIWGDPPKREVTGAARAEDRGVSSIDDAGYHGWLITQTMDDRGPGNGGGDILTGPVAGGSAAVLGRELNNNNGFGTNPGDGS